MKSTLSGSAADALKTTISRQLLTCRTVTVGVADSEPKKNGHVWCVDVLPAIQQIRDVDGSRQYVNIPKLTNVPIVLPCSNALGLSITMPIKKGDEVVLLVSDRSLDNWQLDGGIQRPADETEIRHHDLSDCLCIPSALTIAALDTYNNEAIEIGSPSVNVTVTPQDVVINAQNVTVNAEQAVAVNCDTASIDASTSVDITTGSASIDCDSLSATTQTATIDAAASVDITTQAANVSAPATTIDSAVTTCTGNLVVTGSITGASVAAPAVAAGALAIAGVDLPSDHKHDQGTYSVIVDGSPVPVNGDSGAPK